MSGRQYANTKTELNSNLKLKHMIQKAQRTNYNLFFVFYKRS